MMRHTLIVTLLLSNSTNTPNVCVSFLVQVNKKLKDLAEGRGPEYKEFEMLADSVGEFSTALIDPLKSDDDLRTSFEGCFDVVLDEAIQKKQKKVIYILIVGAYK